MPLDTAQPTPVLDALPGQALADIAPVDHAPFGFADHSQVPHDLLGDLRVVRSFLRVEGEIGGPLPQLDEAPRVEAVVGARPVGRAPELRVAEAPGDLWTTIVPLAPGFMFFVKNQWRSLSQNVRT